MRKFLTSLALLLTAACAAPQIAGAPVKPVSVGIIAINDFHGNMEPPPSPLSLPDGNEGTQHIFAGGAPRLATAIDTIRESHDFHVTVSAGDLIGASPITSSLFLDEPTVEVMNRMGLDFNAVGNHEFDRGRDELLRMQNGGCDKHTQREPCALEHFAGADFQFLSASTIAEDSATLFPATGLKRFGEGDAAVTLGFVGLTLKATPSLVSPGGVAGLTFDDEADAINATIPGLKAAGADAIIVLIHEGGNAAATLNPNGCDGLEGAILPILARLDPRVDVVISGHTHQAYICEFTEPGSEPPVLLTSAGSYGQMVTEISLIIDPSRDRVIESKAANHIVEHSAYAPDKSIAAYVQRYADAVRDIAGRTTGKLSGPASRSADGMGGTLGNVVADAQLAATRKAGAEIALTNPFGIRAPLNPAEDGTLTFGQIYAAQPFGNILVTKTFTGAQLKAVLEQGVNKEGPMQRLAPSSGFAYCTDLSKPVGERVFAMTLNGEPIRADQTYRVTVNSFLAGGGDGFTVFREGTSRTLGGSDLDALEVWLGGNDPRALPTQPRICQATR